MNNNYSKYLSIKSVTAFSAMNYLQAGMSFLVSLLLARELGKEQYGLYAYAIVFANTFSILIQFGMEKTLVRDIIQLNRPAQLIISATVLKGIVSAVLIIPVLIWVWFVGGFSEPKNVVVTLAVLSGMLLGLSPKAWFDASGKIHLNAAMVLIERVFFLFCSISVIYLFKEINNVIVIVVSLLFVGRIIFISLEWGYVLRNIELDFKTLWQDINYLVYENNWVWLAVIGNLLMTQANQIILEGYEGVGELGLYGFAFQLIMLVRLLQSQVLRLTTPSIADVTSSKSKNELMYFLVKYCFLSLGLTLTLVIPLYFVAPIFISTFIGVEFLGSIPVLNILLVWTTLYAVALINNQFLLSFRLQKEFFYIAVSFGLLSLILAYILIPKYLALGAALSLLIAHSGSILVQFILVFKRINQHVIIDEVLFSKKK
jgi:O-antigen/teichoic acid export membrane protein